MAGSTKNDQDVDSRLTMPYDSHIWPEAVEQMEQNTPLRPKSAYRWMERFGRMIEAGSEDKAMQRLENIASSAGLSVLDASRALFDLHHRHCILEDKNPTDMQKKATDWLDYEG